MGVVGETGYNLPHHLYSSGDGTYITNNPPPPTHTHTHTTHAHLTGTVFESRIMTTILIFKLFYPGRPVCLGGRLHDDTDLSEV